MIMVRCLSNFKEVFHKVVWLRLNFALCLKLTSRLIKLIPERTIYMRKNMNVSLAKIGTSI